MRAEPFRHLVLALLLAAGPVAAPATGHAQQPAPAGTSLAEAAARRFPQPVRDLVGRRVLRPQESQPMLGWVRGVVRRPDGGTSVVLAYGGVLGFFARPIAVPVEAMTLLGEHMQVNDFTPEQLARFETFSDAGAARLPPDGVIRVGLSRPSH